MRARIRTAKSKDGLHTYEIIEPLETLGSKVGAGRGFSPEALARAEAMVSRLADDYQTSVQRDLEGLRDALSDARVVAQNGERLASCWQRIRLIAHEIRGQGTTFDYPLITGIAEALYSLLSRNPELPADAIPVVEAHVDALCAVIAEQVRGEGGAIGRELVRGLKAATARWLS